MSAFYMPDSPNGGYRLLAKTERIVSIADDGELFIVRPDDVHERIVRCKDCRHVWIRGDRLFCERDGGFVEVTPTDFCSRGEVEQ